MRSVASRPWKSALPHAGWLRSVVSVTLLGALLALVPGCASGPKFDAKRTVAVALETGKTKTVVNAKVGDLTKLELPPVELPGFGWQIFLLDTRYVKQMSEITPAATPGGRGTLSIFAVRAVPKTTVRLLLVKLDGAKTTQPVDGHDIVFSIE